MTRDQLEAHRLLQKKLNKAKAIYKEQEERAHPGAQRIDGMPRGRGNVRKVEDLGIDLAELSRLLGLDELEREVSWSRPPIDAYIETLEDPDQRLVVGLRILCALSWKEVAVYCGKEYSEGSVKRLFFKAVKPLP